LTPVKYLFVERKANLQTNLFNGVLKKYTPSSRYFLA